MTSHCRSIRILGLALLLGASGLAWTAQQPRLPSALDARVRYDEGRAISGVPVRLDRMAQGDPLRVAWQEWSERHGGSWSVHLDERSALPALVEGPGIPWFAGETGTLRSLDDLDLLARAFLGDEAPLLGDWSDLLELDADASVLVRPGHWQLVYRQRVDGVRVENARLDLHVVRGRLVLMGATNWARPTIRGVPSLEAGEARALVEAWLGPDAALLKPAGAPELTMIAVDADPGAGEPRGWSGPRGEGLRHVLVWRVRLRQQDEPRRWVGEIDATDGTVRAFYESTDYAAVRGGVFPVANDGDCTTGGCEVSGFPMPYADLAEAEQAGTFADPFGNLACVVGDASFETHLSGPYVNVADVCGALTETGDCASGLDLGLKYGENCAVAPGRSPGDTAAARTAYYHLNRVAEIARFYDPANAWLLSPVTVNVNIASTCNANWDGSEINMFGAGSNCNNTGESPGILVHEWGHGYDNNDGGGRDAPGEGYADIVAILAARDGCMGRGTYNDGTTCGQFGEVCLTCTGFREFDWAARQENTPATPSVFLPAHCPSDTSGFAGPCRREPHCESYIASEAIFDLATRDLPASGIDPDSAWQLVDRLWYLTRPGSGGDAYTCLLPLSNSCSATSWYQRMRVADDDDGDLANGTPHAAALYAAFARHAIACGAAGDANNQSTSSCPALTAPDVARSTVPGGIELSWPPVAGAAEYRVYRGETGRNRQQVPIASLPGGQTTFTDDSADSDLLRFYRVQAFGSNPACASPVSSCVAAPPGSRLQVVSHRVEDDGDGVPEPGEMMSLPLTLFNNGADDATATVATLEPVGPAGLRILTPSATWSTIAPGAEVESDAPSFELVLLEEAECGSTLAVDVAGAAENSGPFAAELRIPMGEASRDFSTTPIVPIPSLTTVPVEATIPVGDDVTVADVDITIDIFHQDPTQLIVELTSPQGTTVRLHDRGVGSGHGIETRYDLLTAPSGPGSMADFAGEPAQGTWTLSVQDVDGTGVTTDGYIRPRTLHVTAVESFGCAPQVCADPTPSAAPQLGLERVPGSPTADLAFTWTAVPDAAGYDVLRSEDPLFGAGVRVLGATTETFATFDEEAASSSSLTFFEVRAFNSCHQEGP